MSPAQSHEFLRSAIEEVRRLSLAPYAARGKKFFLERLLHYVRTIQMLFWSLTRGTGDAQRPFPRRASESVCTLGVRCKTNVII